ncbi:MAG: cytochrome c oxidase assembly protein [Microthrixaceae bacterium]
MLLAGAFPKWTPHFEVWLLVIGLLALGFYAARVIQPKAIAAGETPITNRQKTWFGLAVLVFWIAADYPMHDIAEQRLYSMHMIQHSLLMVVFPPMMLLATPTWLARLIIGKGAFKRFVYFWSRPAPALLVNLVVTASMHWAWMVNSSVQSAWLHYSVHMVAVFTSLLVWMCICGPIPELQVGPPLKIVVIFMLSVIPTIPAAFLTVGESVLYKSYDHGPRLWHLSAMYDQQLAGVMMKIITGFYLWGIIAVIFFKWSMGGRKSQPKYRGKLVRPEDAVSNEPKGGSSVDRPGDGAVTDSAKPPAPTVSA